MTIFNYKPLLRYTKPQEIQRVAKWQLKLLKHLRA